MTKPTSNDPLDSRSASPITDDGYLAADGTGRATADAQNAEAASRLFGATRDKLEPLGVSGLIGATPEQGIISDEFLTRLMHREGSRLYREMSQNDPVVHAILLAVQMLVRGVTWSIEAEAATPAGEEAADFAESVLFMDLAHPFDDLLAEVVSMLVYGYCVIEPVYKVRKGTSTDPMVPTSRYDDRKIGVHRFAPRGQDTFYRWLFTRHGDVVGVVQQDPHSGRTVVLPADRILLFRHTTYKANPEGRSILRGAVVSYLRKQLIEEAEGRSAIRSSGIVEVRIPDEFMRESADADQKRVYAAYKAAADRLAADRQGSVVLPSTMYENGQPMFSINYIVADGRRPADMSGIISRLDRMIATSMMADFVLLGQEKVGSFALASNKTDLFAKAVGALLSHIKDVFNRTFLPRLFRLNGMDETLVPKLVHSDIQSPDLAAVASFVSTLASAGATVFPNPELEDKLFEMANLPTRSTERE